MAVDGKYKGDRIQHQVLPATEDAEIIELFPLLHEVCPDIQSESQLLSIARIMILKENCHFVYIRDKIENGQVAPVSFAAYRFLSSLSKGPHMHIHYVGTLPSAKRRGYANALVDWMIAKAKEENCVLISLNSGHDRLAAHRLYMNKGFGLRAHHLTLQLRPFCEEE